MTSPRFIPLLALIGPLLGLAGNARADDLSKEAFEKIVAPFLNDKPYVGVVVGVLTSKEERVHGYGKVMLSDKEQTPDEKTVFEIGSITKIFTGTLLADQVLAKKVRLDDSAQRYLPDILKLPRRDDRDITLLHLATHTSSLPVQPPLLALFALAGPPKDAGNPYKHFTMKKLSGSLEKLNLDRPIGSKSAYSNLGVGLLGHALVGTAQAPNYEQLLIERVLEPLKMSETRIHLTKSMRQRLTPGHDKKGAIVSNWDFACLEACGGLRSNVADMLRFAKAALGSDSPLKAAFAMAQQPWHEDRPNQYTGLCWVRDERPGTRLVIWHNGGTGGYRSYLGLMPGVGCAVVVLSNSNHSVDEMGLALLKLLDTEK